MVIIYYCYRLFQFMGVLFMNVYDAQSSSSPYLGIYV